ncbi:MAG: hypothetical protein ACI9F9_001936, partial [Candidatus Paceibacteria bacterium]
NCMAYLRRSAPLPRPDAPEWLTDSASLDALLAPAALDDAWQIFLGSGAPWLTDDHNPIDRLQQQSIAIRAQQLQELEGISTP